MGLLNNLFKKPNDVDDWPQYEVESVRSDAFVNTDREQAVIDAISFGDYAQAVSDTLYPLERLLIDLIKLTVDQQLVWTPDNGIYEADLAYRCVYQGKRVLCFQDTSGKRHLGIVLIGSSSIRSKIKIQSRLCEMLTDYLFDYENDKLFGISALLDKFSE